MSSRKWWLFCFSFAVGMWFLAQPLSAQEPTTFFHLETVAVNNDELIIHVHYDGTPVPAQVLDLKLEYSNADLTLLDSRWLAAVKKVLSATHLSDGTLRLVVLDPTSNGPIQPGAILELVFRRTSSSQTTVRFVSDDFIQSRSVAPSQGAQERELKNDAKWGPPVSVGAAQSQGPRLVLSYNFDNPRRPLDYRRVPDAAVLCGLNAICSNAVSGSAEQLRVKEMYEALQRGSLQGWEPIEGVMGVGAYFDGGQDHIRLPLILNSPYKAVNQSFSFSTWLYGEGNAPTEPTGAPQLLFSHNSSDLQDTRFGLKLVPASEDSFNLVWFEGAFNQPNQETTIATGLAERRWIHLGMTLDATSGATQFFVDGQRAGQTTLAGTSKLSCPDFESGGAGLRLREETVSGHPPQQLYYAAAENNLAGIMKTDSNGLLHETVIRDGEFSYQDPDYSPLVDKIVYSSNTGPGGSFEIWMADGDGDPMSRKQITEGFGDTARGIFARRPRWAPDASAIVFESNVYDVAAQDNTIARGYHLYRVPYDPANNVVTVKTGGTATVDRLTYSAVLANQIVRDFRLTSQHRNHQNAVWMTGIQGGDHLGMILFTSTDEQFKDSRIERMRIPQNIKDAVSEPLGGLEGVRGDEVTALTAFREVSGTSALVSEKLLFVRNRSTYPAATQFSYNVAESDRIEVVLRHTPSGYEAKCWDLNRNNQLEPDEDLDRDGEGSVVDCYPQEIHNLYLVYDPKVLRFDTVASGLGPDIDSAKKQLDLRDQNTSGATMVRIELRSPSNSDPLRPGVRIAKLLFDRKGPASIGTSLGLELRTRAQEETLFIKDLTSQDAPVPFGLAGVLDVVTAAAYAPGGGQILLAGVKDARPTLIRTAGPGNASGSARILPTAKRVTGLSWTRQPAIYPCNWIGAHKDRATGKYAAAFRGGLDDLKFFSYVREAAAFRSDAARGLERLERESRRIVKTRLPTSCSADLDCPPYQLCTEGTCKHVSCRPSDPYSCPRGRCTQRPESEEASGAPQWVCSAECRVDAQCFREECLNGPCRFCEGTRCVCKECQPTVEDYGTFQISTVKGCPDTNSFACANGACRTECYRFADGNALYTCDPAVEYCSQGRCVLFDWNWNDLAPATFSGLDETRYDKFRYTVAQSQLYPVEIKAYGVEDHLHPPELLVEGRVTSAENQAYGGTWFTIGRLLIHHTTKTEAEAKPYILHTPHKITDLRLRLIVPPYENLNAGATGLRERDKDFCRADAKEWADKHGITAPPYATCVDRPPGSRFTLGYALGISRMEARQACIAHGRGCPADNDQAQKYLRTGSTKVIVTRVDVQGTGYLGRIIKNDICSFEGTPDPIGTDGRPRKMFYGDVAKERSNDKTMYCATHSCTEGQGLVDFTATTGKSWALLNCNYENPDQSSAITISGIEIVERTSKPILETPNGCYVEKGQTTEPCYEWLRDASLDPLNSELQLYRTLEFSSFRGFGYNTGP